LRALRPLASALMAAATGARPSAALNHCAEFITGKGMAALGTMLRPLLLCIALSACTNHSARAPKDAPTRKTCDQYAVEIHNGSAAPVSVFAFGAGSNSGVGAYVGDVSRQSSATLVLPTGMTQVRIDREKGQVPVQGQIRQRILCVTP
jgi:hypothetical protein